MSQHPDLIFEDDFRFGIGDLGLGIDSKSKEDNLLLADEDNLLLADEDDDFRLGIDPKSKIKSPKSTGATWKVMVVDDEREIHDVTNLALEDFVYEGKSLNFIDAYSGKEAKQLIQLHPDTALILLDVVMEENDAGLKVAKYIRKELGNSLVRIILRTGQPGEAPEESVILEYDINDYKTKTELTLKKLFTTIVSTLRTYRDLVTIEASRKELADYSAKLEKMNQQLQEEIEERKKLEAMRVEQERLRIQNEFLEKQARELAKLNADKDKFFSIVAHDLRGPFQPLMGLARLLSKMAGRFGPDDLQEMGDSIYRSAKNVYNLLENLLQWSRMQRGRMEYQPNTLNLKTIGEQNITLLTEIATSKGVTLRNRVGDVFVRADEFMLDTVFRNLISNALKFTSQGGRVTIFAKPCKEIEGDKSFVVINEPAIHELETTSSCPPTEVKYMEIAVVDTGVGISQEDIDKLFKIEVHHTTAGTADERGTGLGLIICQEMVEKNGGHIWIESEEGKGTAIKFTVPLDDSIQQTIEWGESWFDEIFSATFEATPSTEPGETKAFTFPPLEEMNILLDLAIAGDMHGIEKRMNHVEQLEQQYIPFAKQLRQLAKNFEEEKILALVNQYIESQKKD